MQKIPKSEEPITPIKKIGKDLGLSIDERISGGVSDANLTSSKGINKSFLERKIYL